MKLYTETLLDPPVKTTFSISLPSPFPYSPNASQGPSHPVSTVTPLDCGLLSVSYSPDCSEIILECPVLSLVVELPHPGIPWPVVFQDADSGWIHLLWVTCSGVFYRLALDVLEPSGYTLDYYHMQKVSDAVVAHAVDLDTLVVGSTEGKLVQLDCPRRVLDGDEDDNMGSVFVFFNLYNLN